MRRLTWLTLISVLSFAVQAQNVNFISGYSYSRISFDEFNLAVEQNNELFQWEERSFNEINDMHGTMFGIRYQTNRGFMALMWEQKLRSSRAVGFNENNREISERWSFSWTTITLESAITAGPISAGIGINGNRFSTKLDASFAQKRVQFINDLSFGNYFFLELAIGPPNNVQVALRPFYQFPWKNINYKNMNFLLANLEPNTEEPKSIFGLSIMIKNGPKQ